MIIVDVCISFGIPVAAMALRKPLSLIIPRLPANRSADYVVQGHRFDILEDIGCYPVVYNVTLAYPLYLIWSPLLGAVSFVYSGNCHHLVLRIDWLTVSRSIALTLRSFWCRRAQFAQLVSSNSGMTMSRYLRLMALSGLDILFNVPLGILVIFIGAGQGPAPWISWEDTHYNFSRVARLPAILWRLDPRFEASIELTRWLPVFCSFVFFALFGFASEAQKHYRNVFWTVAKRVGLEPRPSPQPPKALLPRYVCILSLWFIAS
jgi:pheromone a factor receptor